MAKKQPQKLRDLLIWCADTLEQSAEIINADIDPDDIDGECAGVREKAKEVRAAARKVGQVLV